MFSDLYVGYILIIKRNNIHASSTLVLALSLVLKYETKCTLSRLVTVTSKGMFKCKKIIRYIILKVKKSQHNVKIASLVKINYMKF